jgi:hypothetical protein
MRIAPPINTVIWQAKSTSTATWRMLAIMAAQFDHRCPRIAKHREPSDHVLGFVGLE